MSWEQMDHLDLMEYKPDINVKSNRVTKSPSFFEQLMEADICPEIKSYEAKGLNFYLMK